MARSLITPLKLLNKSSHLASSFSTSATPFLPNTSICISTLQSCALHKNLSKGKEIHCFMLTNVFLTSLQSITSLINLYSKCNQPNNALSIFNTTTDRNLFTWNSIIAGFVSNQLPNQALQFYHKMRYHDNLIPDKFTFPVVIKACSEINKVVQVEKIHGELFKLALDSDAFIASSLINFYLKFRYMLEARQVFEEMPEWSKDVVLWNAMITGYAQSGLFKEALEVFGKMVEKEMTPSKFTVTGILSVFAMGGDVNNGRVIHGFVMKAGYGSDVVVGNSLIDMYGKGKAVGEAVLVFEQMIERDIFSWNSIISVHEQAADYNGTLRLYNRMRGNGVQPDILTVTSALLACSHLAALMRGREIHGHMIVNRLKGDELNNVYVDNAVMDMYAKCGSLEDARLVFDKMKNRDTASWNIMIRGYGMNGYCHEALLMFSQMCEAHVRPDNVTLVSILTACSHEGLINRGCEILKRMELDHGVVPNVEHYACVVDMLGRAGNLKEAYQLALATPNESNPVVWRTLLFACRLHGNTDLAEIAAKRIFEIEKEDSGGYVLMSNMYGSIGRYENVSDIRNTMKIQKVRRTPGCSWIELKTGVHMFVTGDTSHPESTHIYPKLDALVEHICENGYVLDVKHA